MLRESPTGHPSVKRQRCFLQKMLPNARPNPIWEAFSAIPAGSFMPGLVSPCALDTLLPLMLP